MDDVTGARQKLQRADQHVKDFEARFSAFLRENTYRLVFDLDSSALEKAKLVRDIGPGDFVCIVGDAIHNLRSALDHLAYAVAKRNRLPAALLEKTNFTIRRTSADFDTAIKKGEVCGIGPGWLAFLKATEPYQGGKGGDLFVVSALDNLDKHRDVINLTVYFDTFRWVEPDYVPVRLGIPLEEGVEVCLDLTDPNYHTHTRVRVVISVATPGLDPDAFTNEVLDRLYASVKRVIDDAENDAALWP